VNGENVTVLSDIAPEWLILFAGLAVLGLVAAWVARRSLTALLGIPHRTVSERNPEPLSDCSLASTGSNIQMFWSTIVSRGGLFSLIWWVLTDGTVSSWWIGVPAVLLAVSSSIALIPPRAFRLG